MITSNNKVALVTGASSGIGKASAAALVAAGFVTYATARRPEMVADLKTLGCHLLALDVTDEASMLAVVRTIEAVHGGVTVLVNNAANGTLGAIEEVGLDAWRLQFETNVFGMVRLSQLVLPGMRKQGGGRIINVSSMGGEMTFPFSGSYHATKYAVEALSDALRVEVKPFGVVVVIIQPGAVKTALADAGITSLQTAPDSPYFSTLHSFAQTSRRTVEQGRGMLTPEAVASVIVKAAQAERPKTRYKIGATAHLLTFLRRMLPDRAWDGMMARLLRGSTPATAEQAPTGRA